MASVTQLAQFLLTLNPQAQAARLSFYHWAKNFLDLNAELKAEMIEQFYNHALLISYWQSHQQILGETLLEDLLLFSRSHSLSFDPKEILHSHQMQIIEVKHAQDIQNIIENYLQLTKPQQKFKLLPLSSQKVLTIQATPHQGLVVRVYSHLMKLKGTMVKPLAPLSHLHYSSRLELTPGMPQILQTGHANWAKFQLDEEAGCHGLLVKGYSFQKTEAFLGKEMSEYAELYFGLKQLERFYIDLKSDPLYQELTALLEKALNMVGSSHPEAYSLADNALRRGRMALKNIFPDDKLLRLLVGNLEYRIIEDSPASHGVSPKEDEDSCQDAQILS